MKAMTSLGMFVCLAMVSFAVGQTNEIALTVGGYFPQHINVNADTSFAFEGNFAHRILQVPKLAVSIELPVVKSLSTEPKALQIGGGQSFSTSDYSALFVAPGARLKLFPDSTLAPYFVIGGGLARFSKSGSPSTNTGVLDFGGGIDVKLSRAINLRAEARDFYSGPPQLITGLAKNEHQVLVTAGVVFRF